MEKNELIVIKQLPVIEEQLKGISLEIDKDVEEALELEVNEETVKGVKKTRSQLTKDFKDLEERKLFVKEKILAPYVAFEEVYKKYVSDKYKNADSILKTRVDEVENLIKKEIEEKCESYFNELITKEKIDFVKFEDMKMSITLGMQTKTGNLTKKVIEDIDSFVKSIVTDLQLIDLEEYKVDILVEYKKTLNASGAIIDVKNRMKAIEEEKAKQEELKQVKEEEIKIVEKVEEFTAPVEVVEEVQEEINTMTFKVFGTMEQLKKVKEFLESEGIEYDAI